MQKKGRAIADPANVSLLKGFDGDYRPVDGFFTREVNLITKGLIPAGTFDTLRIMSFGHERFVFMALLN